MNTEDRLSKVPITNPEVSLLIPCFNCADTLETSLRSITNQTFKALEIIAVDDGSTDSTLEILKQFASVDRRIQIIERIHAGIISALDAGMRECRAPLIARMDADDIAHPTRIEKQVEYLRDHPEIAIVGSLVEAIPARGVGEGFKIYLDWMNGLITHEEIVREIFIESPFVHPSVMMRKEWIDQVGGYQNIGWAEDYDLWLRLHLAGARFGKVPEVLLSWRERPDRLTWTDDRYSKENFIRAKSHYLSLGPIKDRDAVIIWGAGRNGKRISKYLLNGDAPIVAFIDIDAAKINRDWRGLPIQPPDKLRELWGMYQNPVLLAAVAARGARELIREHLVSIGLVEGVDWWAVA